MRRVVNSSATILACIQALLQTSSVRRPNWVLMDHFTKGVHDLPVGGRELLSGVECEKRFLLGLDQACLLEFGEMTAQVRLVQLQDGFQVADAKCLLVKKVEDS